MTYVICAPCVNEMAKGCVSSCPVDCIKEADECPGETAKGDTMLYIDPNMCTD